MSHEGERATDARIQDQPERAPPHWLNPFVGLFFSTTALLLRCDDRIYRFRYVIVEPVACILTDSEVFIRDVEV